MQSALEAAEDVKSTIEKFNDIEKNREERREFEFLQIHHVKKRGRPLSAVLAGLDKNAPNLKRTRRNK